MADQDEGIKTDFTQQLVLREVDQMTEKSNVFIIGVEKSPDFLQRCMRQGELLEKSEYIVEVIKFWCAISQLRDSESIVGDTCRCQCVPPA